jgi:hypothetical protein
MGVGICTTGPSTFWVLCDTPYSFKVDEPRGTEDQRGLKYELVPDVDVWQLWCP